MDVAVFDGHVPMVSNCRAAWSSIFPFFPCHVVPDADTIQVHRSFMAGLSIIDDIRFCMIIRAVFDCTLAGCLIVLNDTVFDIRISVVHDTAGDSETSVSCRIAADMDFIITASVNDQRSTVFYIWYVLF